MKKYFGNIKKTDEALINDYGNVNSPIYRSNTGYKATVENGKIKKCGTLL